MHASEKGRVHAQTRASVPVTKRSRGWQDEATQPRTGGCLPASPWSPGGSKVAARGFRTRTGMVRAAPGCRARPDVP